MNEPAAATPRSNSEPQLKTPKDKNCPFCGQSFTSSSLGRHLDLYIRAKNPRGPDGLHNVDEIKKIRGGVTRRQVKGSLKKEDGSTKSNTVQSLTDDASPTIVQSPSETEDTLVLAKVRPPFKDVSWQQSGSANSVPPRANGLRTPEVRRDVSRQMQKAELDQRHRGCDEAETAQATEMALREVLKLVKEANAKASGLGLFDFDPYTLNFPSLCLHILPAPTTLFSPTPFATSDSWSIHPPGQKQLDALNRHLRERLLAHQRQRQMNQMYPPGSHTVSPSTTNSPLPTPPLFDPDPQKLFGHVADAYSHWTSLAEKQRQEAWQLEILRAHARANNLRKEAEISLENAQREIEFLKGSKWSSRSSEPSPLILKFCPESTSELGKQGFEFRNWDYDLLIEKWKTVVRDNKSGGMASQKQLPDQMTRSASMVSLPTHSFHTTHSAPQDMKQPTTYSGPPTTNGTEPSSDQVDAEGEDDDGDVDLDAEGASDEGSMAGQFHGLPLQPTPIHPAQMQAHTQLQAHIQRPLSQAQSQVQAQAHQFRQQQVTPNPQVQAQVIAQAQAQAAHAHVHAQAQAWARQHLNQSRNGHQHPHQHQQLSPHPSHMGSAANSRRTSQVMLESHGMGPAGGMMMEGIENHQDQFLRIGMGLADGFVTSAGEGV